MNEEKTTECIIIIKHIKFPWNYIPGGPKSEKTGM
jgi:hypothetical protein